VNSAKYIFKFGKNNIQASEDLNNFFLYSFRSIIFIERINPNDDVLPTQLGVERAVGWWKFFFYYDFATSLLYNYVVV
jgi:hypothetical protein